jgi:hypothetical protein
MGRHQLNVMEGGKRNKSRPNKIPLDKIQSISDHINLIPKYQGHYSRHETCDNVYLDCGTLISKSYTEMYVPLCGSKIKPV